MLDPLEFEKQPLAARLRRMRQLAWLALVWERAAAAFWPADCWVFLFAGLWLLQIPSILGPAGNAGALALFLAGLSYFLGLAFRKFRWPDRHAVDRRLEEASSLPHRPLERLEDRLANPQKEPTRQLWKKGRDNAFTLILKLRASWPRPVLAAGDPFSLRMLTLLLLVTGIVVAGPVWRERLAFGLLPFSVHWQDRVSDNIVLWITPPAYTGQPQITVQGSGKSDKAIDIVQGSIIKLRVRNGFGQPELVMGETRIPLQRLGETDKKSWGAEAKAIATDEIEIRQMFLTRAALPVKYIEDKPPQITLRGETETLPKGPLRIPLTVQDDFGVTDIRMTMNIDSSIEDPPLGASVEDSRAVMSPPGMEQEIAPVYDLTWHSWAGLPVTISIEARDHLGQTATLEPIKITLPERPFYHPVARELVEMRRRLIWSPLNAAPNIAADLEKLLERPDLFGSNIVVFLSLRSMSSRLYMAPTMESALAVIPQLWDTALGIEDGNLTMAARNLRDAKQALEKLLADGNATDEQIANAMDDLRMAMAEYFQELAQELQKRMAEDGMAPPQISQEALMNSIDGDALAAFLDQLQSEALSGSRDSARQMLSQLQNMMDMLDPSMSMQMPPQMQQLMEGMSALQDLIERQQDLLDRTQQQAERMRQGGQPIYPDSLPLDEMLLEKWNEGAMPPPPQETQKDMQDKIPPPAVKTAQEGKEQEKLRFMLGELMAKAGEKLDEIPEGMQKAEQEMRGASEQLRGNQPDLAAPHQEQALKHLKESMESMNQQMQAMMKQMTFLSLGMGPLDPLGRPLSEGDGPSIFPGSKVKIPDEAQRKRVQEILQILRKRSGELTRPDYELEYYRRLMRQF